MIAIVLNVGVLKTLPLFSFLSDDELATLLPSIKHRSYRAGSYILRAGEDADGLYLLLSGRVKLLLQRDDGRELMLYSLGPNEFFGEIGLIDGGPRSATIQAHDASEVLYVPASRCTEYFLQNFAATRFLLRTTVVRLRSAYQKIHDLALLDVYGRVARTLLESSLEGDGEWLVGPGCEQIASMVGASRESVSRVLKNMINRGLIRRQRRKLIVLDRTALAAETRDLRRLPKRGD